MRTIKGLLMVLVVMVSMIGCNKADQVETVKETKKDNIFVQHFFYEGETDTDKLGTTYKVTNVNDINDSVWLDEKDVKGLNMSAGDKVAVTYNHDDVVKVEKENNDSIVYTVDKVDDKYHAVSGNESVEFTLNDVDGMITGVGDRVTVTYKDEMGENVKVIEVVK